MKKLKILAALLGALAYDATAGCSLSGTPRWCAGKLEYVFTTVTGTATTKVLSNSNAEFPAPNASPVLTLDPTFLGSNRFNQIFQEMNAAVYRDAAMYVEFDDSNRITAFGIWNPDVLPNEN